MGTLKVILTKISGNSKSPYEYELYKYEDIRPEWIIHCDQLQYLYNTTILGDSLFKTYRVVLARVPIENMEDVIGLYLYLDEKKPPSYFFPVDRRTKINGRCDKTITPIPKCFLFELKSIEKDKPDIFGAKDNANRLIWVEKLQNIFSKPKSPSSASSLSYLQPIATKKSREISSNSFNQGSGLFYRQFDGDYARHHSVVNDVDNNEQQSASSLRTQSDLDLSYSKVESINYPQSLPSNKKEHSASSAQLQSFNDSYISQEKIFVWNEVFYPNENDDYKSVLTKAGEPGAFLIRPQSKKTSSSDHDYTLCLYYQMNDIRCFGINELSSRGNEYSLSKKGSKSFVDMIQLCQYYTTNPLPMAIQNVYLKKPYKSYEHELYYIE